MHPDCHPAAGSGASDVGIYHPSWSHPYDYRWQTYPFEVLGSVPTGPLAPPHRWSVE